MQLEEFLKNSKYFSLGHLPSEGFHPETKDLSHWVHTDLKRAIQTVQKIDLDAMKVVLKEEALLQTLAQDIEKTLAKGHRIFLSGCGATGRLVLGLESTWRASVGTKRPELQNKIQALMAGGDFALVKSVENFEDFPEYGERHLQDLGFQEGDLLIAVTEGGETPYVLGTVHAALAFSSTSPWFVYCNPTELLCKTVERSRVVIENPRVKNLCLSVGNMALSGSTRLQAATAQMLAVGVALFQAAHPHHQKQSITTLLQEMIDGYQKLDLSRFLAPVVKWESDSYLNGATVLYQTHTYPIAVLTDTTERSPTFSLTPFEKSNDTSGTHSLCYLSIPGSHTALDSWKAILNRLPIGLEWPELQGRLSLESILEFDFGREATEGRAKRVAPKKQNVLTLEGHHTLQTLEFKSDAFTSTLKTSLLAHPLLEQILVKLTLNTLSLMVMGLLNRYEGNVMTWVRPSNGKLIDRTVRYLEFLIPKRGLKPIAWEALVKLVYEIQPTLASDESVILKALELHFNSQATKDT